MLKTAQFPMPWFHWDTPVQETDIPLQLWNERWLSKEVMMSQKDGSTRKHSSSNSTKNRKNQNICNEEKLTSEATRYQRDHLSGKKILLLLQNALIRMRLLSSWLISSTCKGKSLQLLNCLLFFTNNRQVFFWLPETQRNSPREGAALLQTPNPQHECVCVCLQENKCHCISLSDRTEKKIQKNNEHNKNECGNCLEELRTI